MIFGAPPPNVEKMMRAASPPSRARNVATFFDIATLGRPQRCRHRDIVEGIDRGDIPHDGAVVISRREREYTEEDAITGI
jgi:hypothetical protein